MFITNKFLNLHQYIKQSAVIIELMENIHERINIIPTDTNMAPNIFLVSGFFFLIKDSEIKVKIVAEEFANRLDKC